VRKEDIPAVPDVVASTVEVTSTDNSQNNTEQTTKDTKDLGEDQSHLQPSTNPTTACNSTPRFV